jgi:hypothetical protein
LFCHSLGFRAAKENDMIAGKSMFVGPILFRLALAHFLLDVHVRKSKQEATLIFKGGNDGKKAG